MERLRAQEDIKKGPWSGEEDEILMNFVKENGPRDWSSIRSKGLLPRTGKSCRLRWVNKLQPNLKKGCKFSAEEERVVLELQATLGNKWAAIATYLPGRTDNDVKNFWSTRQKRLARILRASSQPNRAHKHTAKAPVVNEASTLQASVSSFNQVKETSLQCHICSCFWSENANAINILPPPDCLNMGTAGVISGVPPAVDEHTSPPQLCIQSNNHQPSVSPPFGISFSTEQPKPALNNLPLWQENQDFGAELGEPNFMGALTQQESLEVGNMAQHNLGLSLDELEATGQNFSEINDYKDKMLTIPDTLFGDLSDDMLDNLDAVPRSSS
ncbi:probable transcription factor MYB58 [Coffea arabica]|uniref:Probable transcription factor MYB58 n=1 Tax=Coffea arabica TaxID=13443 RepID=A0ABM4VDK4_COFAR